MKNKSLSGAAIAPLIASAAILLPLAPGLAVAQKESIERGPVGTPTDRDLPGDATKYYGQRPNQYRDIGRRLAKLDLDGDFNYDGVIDNDDPADNGAFQQTPPGLVLGTGELSKLVLRLRPYHLDFKGRAVVSIQVDGINRADKSGRFASMDEEMASVGHIRVWKDASRNQLILDSQDPNRRLFEWAIDDSKYPANVPGIVPRTLYVEGVSESGEYSGDIRLLVKVQHRAEGATTTQFDSEKGGLGAKDAKGGLGKEPIEEPERSKTVKLKRFATGYDHILLTVQRLPHPKEFVDSNNDGVWKTR